MRKKDERRGDAVATMRRLRLEQKAGTTPHDLEVQKLALEMTAIIQCEVNRLCRLIPAKPIRIQLRFDA